MGKLYDMGGVFLWQHRCLLEEGNLLTCHPVHYHNIWLLDAVGHAGFIHCSLDEVENELREKSKCFKIDFEGLHQKAMEFKGYLRTGLESFPALLLPHQACSS